MYTKGKWKYFRSIDPNSHRWIIRRNNSLVAWCIGGKGAHAEANARRICLANNHFDELLDVCRDVVAGNVDAKSVQKLLAEIEKQQ